MEDNQQTQTAKTRKTILAVWHAGSKGKTDTLREFAKELLLNYPNFLPVLPIPAVIPPNVDFQLIVDINGRRIGIESQGDPNTNLHGRLVVLADQYKCDVILCSTRTRGDTVSAVEDIVRTRGFTDIWTSTYQIHNKANHGFVNNLKGKHILELLQRLGAII